MSTVFSMICMGPSFQKMTHHFLLHGSPGPANLEKNLKPCFAYVKFGENKTLAKISEFTLVPVLCADPGPYVVGPLIDEKLKISTTIFPLYFLHTQKKQMPFLCC